MHPDARRSCVVISGQIACGKTTLAKNLADAHGYIFVPVRNALMEILGGTEWSRSRLQKEGANLDKRTSGRWLLHYVQRELETAGRLVVDSGRTRRQVEPILEEINESRLVFLDASEEARRQRYHLAARTDPIKRNVPFAEAMNHDTERRATDLKSMAHVVVDTDGLGPEVVLREVEAGLGLGEDEIRHGNDK